MFVSLSRVALSFHTEPILSVGFVVRLGKQMAVSLNEFGRPFSLRLVDSNVELDKEILELISNRVG